MRLSEVLIDLSKKITFIYLNNLKLIKIIYNYFFKFKKYLKIIGLFKLFI